MDTDRIKIDIEPVKLLFLSEPYVIYNGYSYQPVAEVMEQKRRTQYIIYLSPQTLAQQLYYLIEQYSGSERKCG